MIKPVYAYWLQPTTEELLQWARALGDKISFWVADLATFQIGLGLPPAWYDQGAVFNHYGELRWWKERDGYQAILLMEQPVQELQPLEGNWEAKEETIFLQDLTEPRVHPSFDKYPHGSHGGKIQVSVYRQNGVTVWISPRAWVNNEEA